MFVNNEVIRFQRSLYVTSMSYCLLYTSPGFTITNQKPKKHAENGTITPLPKLKKFYTLPLAGKVMLNVFWDEQEIILKQYTHTGEK